MIANALSVAGLHPAYNLFRNPLCAACHLRLTSLLQELESGHVNPFHGVTNPPARSWTHEARRHHLLPSTASRVTGSPSAIAGGRWIREEVLCCAMLLRLLRSWRRRHHPPQRGGALAAALAILLPAFFPSLFTPLGHAFPSLFSVSSLLSSSQPVK